MQKKDDPRQINRQKDDSLIQRVKRNGIQKNEIEAIGV